MSFKYTYPDEDFCLFHTFPHERLVVPVLHSPALTSCTNVTFWLTRHYGHYISSRVSSYYFTPPSVSIYYMCLNISTDHQTHLADRKAAQCRFGSSQNIQFTADFTSYDIDFVYMLTESLILFVLTPLVCLLGLILNSLVIWSISENQKSELKEDFYKYMSLNAKFNCIYSLIYMFTPINYCSNYPSGVFCSLIYDSLFAQYFKIIVIAYLGESVKLCANVSYILMTVNRYMLIGREHNKILEAVSKVNFVKFTFGLVSSSLALNIGYIFQFRANNGNDFYMRGQFLFHSYDFYPSIEEGNKSFTTFLIMLYMIVNYFLFLIINTSIELVIVYKLRKEIRDKKERFANMTTGVSGNSNLSFRQRRKAEADDKKERRAITMVLVNGLVNLFLRFPEFFTFFNNWNMLFEASYLYFWLCEKARVCKYLMEVANFAYLLTFSTNCVIYYLFNAKFRQTFQAFTRVKRK